MIKQTSLFLILSIVLIFCTQNQQNQNVKILTANIMLSALTDNYEFVVDYNGQMLHKVSFFNKLKKWISAGDIFQFKTITPLYVLDMKLSNIHGDKTGSLQFFKLYINDKLAGKYKVAEKVIINKKVSSIRILFLKTDNEHLVEGWKGTTVLKLLKTDGAKKKLFSPQIDLSVQSKQKLKLEVFKTRLPYAKKVWHLNQKFTNFFFNSNHIITSGLHRDKKASKTIQYNIRIHDDGTFRLYQLVSDNVRKKIIREFFLNGIWQCTELYGEHAKLVFEGKLTGYFPDRKTQMIQGKYIKVKSVINAKLLNSDKLIDEIYIDFPDDALVNVKRLIPDLISDMAYAGEKNFTGERLYPCNKCFLRYEVARALNKVQRILRKDKMSLKLFDCYRPFSVQATLFEKFPVPGYVADPVGGSAHNRGSAVDLTIIDKNGNALDMGTEFDELSAKSNHSYLYFSDTIIKNRLFLKELMQSCNFTPIRSEWWHYNYLYARKYPKINDEFLCD